MALFDTLIEQTNPDLQDLLGLLRDRVRWLYGYIVQGIVDNPGVAVAAARSSTVSAYAVQFPTDNFLSLNPGNCFDALVTRHGTGSTAGEKWADFKTKVLNLTDNGALKSRYIESLEEGTLPPIAEVWAKVLTGDTSRRESAVPDLVVTEVRETTPGPTYRFLKERIFSSASLGKSVRITYTNVFDGKNVVVTQSAPEVV